MSCEVGEDKGGACKRCEEDRFLLCPLPEGEEDADEGVTIVLFVLEEGVVGWEAVEKWSSEETVGIWNRWELGLDLLLGCGLFCWMAASPMDEGGSEKLLLELLLLLMLSVRSFRPLLSKGSSPSSSSTSTSSYGDSYWISLCRYSAMSSLWCWA